MAYDIIAAADYAEASQVYNQATDQCVQTRGSNQWCIFDDSTDHVMTINPTALPKPVSWAPYNEVNTTIKVPLGFTAAQAVRLMVLFNNLP